MTDPTSAGHDVLVWHNPPGGRTSRAKALPPGWVWTCSCKTTGTGFPTEDAADEAAEFHTLGALMDGAAQ